VAVYTNEDFFPIAFESEEELLKWFIPLLEIHLADKISEGEELKPIYGKENLVHQLEAHVHTALRHIYLIQSSLQITCLIIKVLGSNSCKEESCGGFIISFLF
jgi:hypothetical protein